MARHDDAVAELERAPVASTAENPRAVFAVGRGGRGKTVAYRWMIDRALNQGRQIIVADADRTNQTLAAFFGKLVVSPPSAADDDMCPWLDGLLEKAISERQSLIVDLGGGDQLLKHAAMELGLTEFLERNSIIPVVLHFAGADSDDLLLTRDRTQPAAGAGEDGDRLQCRGGSGWGVARCRLDQA